MPFTINSGIDAHVGGLLERRSHPASAWRAAVAAISYFIAPAAIFLCGCEMKVSREMEARVLELQGSTTTSGSAGPTGRILLPDSRWKTGERLQVHADAAVDLLLLPGALIHVENNSDLVLRKLSLAKNGHAFDGGMQRSIRIELVNGTLVVLIRFKPKFGDCVVQTPFGSLSIGEPVLCRLEVDGSKLRLTAIRGALEFTSAESAKSSRLEAGHFQEWPALDQTPRVSELDLIAQQTIEKTFDVERKLLKWQDRWRLAPFPWRSYDFSHSPTSPTSPHTTNSGS